MTDARPPPGRSRSLHAHAIGFLLATVLAANHDQPFPSLPGRSMYDPAEMRRVRKYEFEY